MKSEPYWFSSIAVNTLFSLLVFQHGRQAERDDCGEQLSSPVYRSSLLSCLYWLGAPYKETPLVTDVLVGIVPSEVTAGLAHLLAARDPCRRSVPVWDDRVGSGGASAHLLGFCP